MAQWPYNTSRWAKLRLRKLAANPTCEPCQRRGVLRPANTVDHNVAINAGGPAFPPLDGVTSMCPTCHGEKTSAEDRPDRRAGAGLMRGCDVDGRPLDPHHEWNRPRAWSSPEMGRGQRTDGAITRVVTSKKGPPGWA